MSSPSLGASSSSTPSAPNPPAPPPADQSQDAAGALPAGPILADASFILAVLERHPGASALAASGVLSRTRLLSVTYLEILGVLARAGTLDAAVVEEGLRTLGVTFTDLSSTAGRLLPAVLAADAAARAASRQRGEKPAGLSLGDRCVLTHASLTGLPVLTGDRYWMLLEVHGLEVDVHTYQDRVTS